MNKEGILATPCFCGKPMILIEGLDAPWEAMCFSHTKAAGAMFPFPSNVTEEQILAATAEEQVEMLKRGSKETREKEEED